MGWVSRGMDGTAVVVLLAAGMEMLEPSPGVSTLRGRDPPPWARDLLGRCPSEAEALRRSNVIAIAVQAVSGVLSGCLPLVAALSKDDCEAVVLGEGIQVLKELLNGICRPAEPVVG